MPIKTQKYVDITEETKNKMLDDYAHILNGLVFHMLQQTKKMVFKDLSSRKLYEGSVYAAQICEYSLEDLKRDVYSIIGVATDKHIFWSYPHMMSDDTEVLDEEVNGMILLMNLTVIGFKDPMIVKCYKNYKGIEVAENVHISNRHEWWMEIEKKLKLIKAPKILTKEELGLKIPTLETVTKDYIVSGYTTQKSFSIITRSNDVVYDKKDPNKKIFSNYNIFYKEDDLLYLHPYLKNLQAHVIVPNGVFYVVSGEDVLYFLKLSSGVNVKVANKENVWHLDYNSNKLIITKYIRLVQTGYNVHYDVGGYMDEEWRNEYRIDTEEEVMNLSDINF